VLAGLSTIKQYMVVGKLVVVPLSGETIAGLKVSVGKVNLTTSFTTHQVINKGDKNDRNKR